MLKICYVAGLPSGPVYVDRLREIQDLGSSGELHLGTYSFSETQPCSLRPVLRLRLSKLANSLAGG